MLAAVKGKSLRDGLRPPLTAAPRSAPAKSGRDEEMSQARSNKEMQLTTPLTAIAPYKSLGRIGPFAKPPAMTASCAMRSLGFLEIISEHGGSIKDGVHSTSKPLTSAQTHRVLR